MEECKSIAFRDRLTHIDHAFFSSNYVNQATALAQNLTYASGNTLIMRADSKTTLTATGPGRNSVRIRSRKTYKTHVVVYALFSYVRRQTHKLMRFSFDIRHMPQGCSTWPAAWETSEDDWPDSGEVDIVGLIPYIPSHPTDRQ